VDNLTFLERIRKARNLIPCLALIAFVMGAMFTGYATATEAASFGVLGALAIAVWSRSLTRENLWASLMGATRLSCMILFILAGAAFLSSCMAFTGIPRALAEWVASLNASPLALIGVLALVYLLLGTALDGISMIVLTTSIVLPMVEAAGFDLIWFGIFIVILVEIAELTPPLGFNLFVLQTMSGRDSNYVALASLPFFFLMVMALAIVVLFPPIATWLPEIVIGAAK
jgi:tripartite ATP-independent transporter DctM subunit